ncbi:MAG: LapA family protein [Ferrovibrio sp.]
MRFLRVLFGALVLLILIVFAVANKQAVTVSADPLPFEIALPLYLLVFAVFLAGLLIGAVFGRINAWSAARQKAKADKQRAARQAVQSTSAAGSGGQLPPPAPIV